MASDAAFEVALRGRTDTLEADLKKADDLGEKARKSIEDNFAKLNPSIGPALDRMRSEASDRATITGTAIGVALGAAIVAATTEAFNRLRDIIDQLSKFGDRADDLRLPVNLLQALSVAADQARVSSDELNSALDKFTEVSKKDEDGAKSLYDALNAINGALGQAFKDAPTQAERLRVIADAFSQTRDEVQTAQLALAAFGTDNQRLISIFSGGRSQIAEYIAQVKALGLEIDEAGVQRAQEARSQLNLLARVLTDQLSSSLVGLIPNFVSVSTYLARLVQLAVFFKESFGSDAAKSVETLNIELETLNGELAKATQRRDLLKSAETNPDVANARGFLRPSLSDQQKARSFVGGLLGIDLSESSDDVDKEIADIQTRIDKVKALIDQANKAGQPAKVELPAFAARPSESDTSADTKDAFDRQVDSINRHIAAMQADADAVGETAGEHEKLRTEAALTEALLRSGNEINDEYAAKMDKIAAAAQEAANRLEASRTKFQGVNDALRFTGNELVDVFDQATQKGAKFGTIMEGVLRNLIKQLLEASLTGEGAFGKLFGLAGTNGGVGGILGGIGHLFGFAGGGDPPVGQPSIVGENGPEIFVPKVPGTIIPNSLTGRGTFGGGNAGIIINNYSNEKVQAQPSSSPGDPIKIMIGAVGKAIASGQLDSSLSARFSVRPALARRG